MLYICSRDEIVVVDLSKVAYIKAEGYYSRFCYVNGTSVLVSVGIGRIEKMLREKGEHDKSDFVRTGRSHIINIRRVSYVSLSTTTIRLADETGQSCILQLTKNELKLVANHIVANYHVNTISPDTPREY